MTLESLVNLDTPQLREMFIQLRRDAISMKGRDYGHLDFNMDVFVRISELGLEPIPRNIVLCAEDVRWYAFVDMRAEEEDAEEKMLDSDRQAWENAMETKFDLMREGV